LYRLYKCGIEVKNIKSLLGPRLQVASTGGAHCSDDILSFCNDELRLGLVALYGSRETGGISRNNVVFPGVRIHIRPVDEDHDSHSSTKAESNHKAIGEICVSSPRLVSGYTNAAETSKKFINIDGSIYYRTGDIGQLSSDPSTQLQTLRVLGRVERMHKLASGVWEDPLRRLEDAAEDCDGVIRAFAFKKHSLDSRDVFYIVAAVSHLDASNSAAMRLLLHKHFLAHRISAPFRPSFALFVSHDDPVLDGLVTCNGKKRSALIQKRFTPLLSSFIENEEDDQQNLSDSNGIFKDLFPPHIFEAIANNSDLDKPIHSFGVDSVSAMGILAFLKHKCSIEFSISQFFSLLLSDVVSLIRNHNVGAGTGARPIKTYEGKFDWKEEISNVLLQLSNALEVSLTTEPMDIKEIIENRKTSNSAHFLFTGATGFVGPVLLCRLIRKIVQSGLFDLDATFITCLVRGVDGRRRVLKGIEECGDVFALDDENSDSSITKELMKFIESNLIVVEGDMSKTKLGLSDIDYDRLLLQVTDVVHNASMVSYLLPYSAMRSANVIANIELVKFCHSCNCRTLCLTYISSTSALSASAMTVSASLQPPIAFSASDFESKSEAYGQTKAMAELILLNAKLPLLNIVRPSAIASHSVTGFTNKSDFTVLLTLVCKYVVNCTVRDATVALNCVPVDFVADISSSIIVLADRLSVADRRVNHFNVTQAGPLVNEFINEIQLDVPVVDVAHWRARLGEADLENYELSSLAVDFPTTNDDIIQKRIYFLNSVKVVKDWMLRYPFHTKSRAGIACMESTSVFLSMLAERGHASLASPTINADNILKMLEYLAKYLQA